MTERHVARLWEVMAMTYGHRWTGTYGVADDGTWLTGLSGLTACQVAIGLRRCKIERPDAWPPALPEFRALCFPTYAELGLPEKHAAYIEAVNAARDWTTHEWSHPAVYHAALAVGTWALSSLPERTTRSMFDRFYEQLAKSVMLGESLECPVRKALPNKVLVQTPEVAESVLHNLHQILHPGKGEACADKS